MFANALRASRQHIARAALRQPAVRTLITPTAVRQADLVQELYLKELKAYKPTPIKANDSEGQVLKFAIPKPPQSPEETDLQSGLAEYEAQTPDVAGSSTDAEAAPVEQDWFEEDPEEAAAAAKAH